MRRVECLKEERRVSGVGLQERFSSKSVSFLHLYLPNPRASDPPPPLKVLEPGEGGRGRAVNEEGKEEERGACGDIAAVRLTLSVSDSLCVFCLSPKYHRKTSLARNESERVRVRAERKQERGERRKSDGT